MATLWLSALNMHVPVAPSSVTPLSRYSIARLTSPSPACSATAQNFMQSQPGSQHLNAVFFHDLDETLLAFVPHPAAAEIGVDEPEFA